MTLCKNCNEETETLYSETRGERYCIRCGAVLEENCIVETITFTEGSNGVVRANGQFIPSSGFGTTSLSFSSKYDSRVSREQALQRGYANIQRIADRLHLSLHLVEAAQRIYLMGVQRNFTLGRITSHVAAACLYTSCRREKSERMLIDFSDILCTPVRILGRVFVKLIRVLRIDVPTIDPSLFMERFARQIDLRDKTNAVVQTGVRVIQAMTRDWISTGRRPTGLCGAALLIAARFHGFKVNAEDISRVVRMASSTVSKRLNEFKHTSTAQLKLHEFEEADLLSLPILRGPPCIESSRKALRALPAEVPELPEKELCTSSVESSKEENHNETTLCDDDSEHTDAFDMSIFEDNPQTPSMPRILLPVEVTDEEIFVPDPSAGTIALLADRLVTAIEQYVPNRSTVQEGVTMKDSKGETSVYRECDNDPLNDLFCDLKKSAASLLPQHNEPKYANDTHSDTGELKTIGNEEDDHIDDSLSDVDDEEIDAMILSDAERHAKTLMWDELMKDVMPEVHRRFVAQKRKEGSSRPYKTRRLNNNRLVGIEGDGGLASPSSLSTASSVRLCLEAKNPMLAKQLNSNALEALFSDHPLNGSPPICSLDTDSSPPSSSLPLLFA